LRGEAGCDQRAHQCQATKVVAVHQRRQQLGLGEPRGVDAEYGLCVGRSVSQALETEQQGGGNHGHGDRFQSG